MSVCRREEGRVTWDVGRGGGRIGAREEEGLT